MESSTNNPVNMKRPSIPNELYQPTVKGFTSYLAFSVSFLLLFGYLATLVAKSDLPVLLKFILDIPLFVFAGHGFHLLGWFGHDGVHLSLVKNKFLSMAIGCFVAGASTFSTLGYGVTHWNHHRYTNQESDPDTQIYPRYHGFWSRFFFSRFAANRGYVINTLKIAFNRPIDVGYRLPFTDGWLRFYAFFTLVSIGFWIGLYLYIGVYVNSAYAIYGIIIPLITSIPITGLRIYLEHTSTDAGIFRDTRTYSSIFWTFMMFGNNMHLEHHLYPRVPAYHLPKVHRILKNQGYLDKWQSHVVPGILRPLEFITGKHQYPTALHKNLTPDPFDVQ